MNVLSTASSLDFDGWIRGILSAGISGGASAVSGAIVLPALDAEDFNVYTAKFYIAIGALFLANALVSITKFLSAQPLPGVKVVERTTQTITAATIDTPKVVETIKETHVEPSKGD
jgi:hypothetical protein